MALADPWLAFADPVDEGPDGAVAGLKAPGNIDIHQRPIVKNADGTISTVRSISIGTDQGEVLIPTVSDDGRVMTDDEAVATYRKTGKHLGIFDSPANATAFANSLHDQQAQEYGGQPPANDAFAQDADPVDPTQVVDSTESVAGFADQMPDPVQGDLEMPDEVRAEAVRMLSEHPMETAASDARRYLASKGWVSDDDNFDKVIEFRAKHNTVDRNLQVMKPKPLGDEGPIVTDDAATGALARGIVDVPLSGFADEVYGLKEGVRKTVTGQQGEEGFWHDVHYADDVFSGRVDHDEAEHPLARISGQLIGGLAIPLSYEGVGLRAGTLAMKEAKAAGSITAQEALKVGRKAAARAVTKAMARDGAVIGGAHGVGTGEGGIANRVAEGSVEAGLGILGGAAVGAVGEVVAPRIAVRAAAARALPATEEQQIIQAGDRQGVDILPADVGGPVTRRASSWAAQTIAGGQPIIKASEHMHGQAQAARDRIAATIGQALEPEAAGQAAISGARDAIRTTADDARVFYSAAEKASKGLAINAPKAVANLDKHISELGETPGGAPGLGVLQGLRDSLANGKASVAGIRRMRTVLRDQFLKEGLTGSDLERRVNQVADAAAQDVQDGLSGAGLKDAAEQFAKGDAAWKARAKLIDEVIEPIIGKPSTAKSGEAVIKTLTADLQGNNARAVKFLNSLPESERANVRASIIGALGKAKAGKQGSEGENFSLDTFLTNWNQVGKSARSAYFGPEANAALTDLAKIAEGTREAQGYRNFSNTGGVIGNAATALTALAGILPFLKTVGTQYGVGRLLASPKFARWLARAPKSSAGQLAHIQRLGRVAKSEPAIASDVLSLQHRLTEAFRDPAMRAAAEDDMTGNEQTP